MPEAPALDPSVTAEVTAHVPPPLDVPTAPSPEAVAKFRTEKLSTEAHNFATIAAQGPEKKQTESVDQTQLQKETVEQYPWYGDYLKKADAIREKGLTDKERDTLLTRKRNKLEKAGKVKEGEEVTLNQSEVTLAVDKKVYRSARNFAKKNLDQATDIVTSTDGMTSAADAQMRAAVIALTVENEDKSLQQAGKTVSEDVTAEPPTEDEIAAVKREDFTDAARITKVDDQTVPGGGVRIDTFGDSQALATGDMPAGALSQGEAATGDQDKTTSTSGIPMGSASGVNELPKGTEPIAMGMGRRSAAWSKFHQLKNEIHAMRDDLVAAQNGIAAKDDTGNQHEEGVSEPDDPTQRMTKIQMPANELPKGTDAIPMPEHDKAFDESLKQFAEDSKKIGAEVRAKRDALLDDVPKTYTETLRKAAEQGPITMSNVNETLSSEQGTRSEEVQKAWTKGLVVLDPVEEPKTFVDAEPDGIADLSGQFPIKDAKFRDLNPKVKEELNGRKILGKVRRAVLVAAAGIALVPGSVKAPGIVETPAPVTENNTNITQTVDAAPVTTPTPTASSAENPAAPVSLVNAAESNTTITGEPEQPPLSSAATELGTSNPEIQHASKLAETLAALSDRMKVERIHEGSSISQTAVDSGLLENTNDYDGVAYVKNPVTMAAQVFANISVFEQYGMTKEKAASLMKDSLSGDPEKVEKATEELKLTLDLVKDGNEILMTDKSGYSQLEQAIIDEYNEAKKNGDSDKAEFYYNMMSELAGERDTLMKKQAEASGNISEDPTANTSTPTESIQPVVNDTVLRQIANSALSRIPLFGRRK